jgi:tetratricopeptide (TPR) repeat protein
MKVKQASIVAVVIGCLAPGFARADDRNDRKADGWIGKVVFPKYSNAIVQFNDTSSAPFQRCAVVTRDFGDSVEILQTDALSRPLLGRASTRSDVGRVAKQDAVREEESEGQFTGMLRHDSRSTLALVNRGDLRRMRGMYDAAATDFDAALRLTYDDAERADVLRRRAATREAAGDWPSAEGDWSQALRTLPYRATLHLGRAKALAKLERYPEAVDGFEAAFELEPSDAEVLRSFAMFRASCPNAAHRNGREALELAKRALEVDPQQTGPSYVVLAAAYAEVGDFENAANAQQRAILDHHFTPEEKVELAEHFTHYRTGRPHRDTPAPKKVAAESKTTDSSKSGFAGLIPYLRLPQAVRTAAENTKLDAKWIVGKKRTEKGAHWYQVMGRDAKSQQVAFSVSEDGKNGFVRLDVARSEIPNQVIETLRRERPDLKVNKYQSTFWRADQILGYRFIGDPGPGQSKAVLISADGKKIVSDDT